MTKKQQAADESADITSAIEMARDEQDFLFHERRADVALRAVELNVISGEEAGAVVRAFLGLTSG